MRSAAARDQRATRRKAINETARARTPAAPCQGGAHLTAAATGSTISRARRPTSRTHEVGRPGGSRPASRCGAARTNPRQLIATRAAAGTAHPQAPLSTHPAMSAVYRTACTSTSSNPQRGTGTLASRPASEPATNAPAERPARYAWDSRSGWRSSVSLTRTTGPRGHGQSMRALCLMRQRQARRRWRCIGRHQRSRDVGRTCRHETLQLWPGWARSPKCPSTPRRSPTRTRSRPHMAMSERCRATRESASAHRVTATPRSVRPRQCFRRLSTARSAA
jgi:hypothetical protein